MEPGKGKIKALIEKGVIIHMPQNVEIGEEVRVENIYPKSVIHANCRIFGRKTIILGDSVIGEEGPATVVNCLVGPEVKLKGGYFNASAFHAKSSMGSGAHVRECTLLEEEASGAHTVGLKHTILFPFVTLGSLINFCDCLMSGGTSRKDHSEVGSSYIHFNYTPNQDKATPSLIGDVPNGVMLDQPPIFLGGQGGLVGPSRIAFGTVTAAGSVIRKDIFEPKRMVAGGSLKRMNIPFEKFRYRNLNRILYNNLFYIANLYALIAWYETVRSLFVSRNFYPEKFHAGIVELLENAVSERIGRLDKLIDNVLSSLDKNHSNALKMKQTCDMWPRIRDVLEDPRKDAGLKEMEIFCDSVEAGIRKNGKNYLVVIKDLTRTEKEYGRKWLTAVVEEIIGRAFPGEKGA